jgi:hypothetical protein
MMGKCVPKCHEVHKAVAKDCVITLKRLVSRGADVDGRNKFGATPLSAAISLGHIRSLKSLLELGANTEAVDGDGNTPLCIAICEHNLAAVEILAEYGTNLNALIGIQGWTAVMIAAQQGSEIMLTTLIKSGADINTRSGNGESALDLVASAMDMDTAVLLVNSGADISSYMEAIAVTADIHDMFHAFCQSCFASNCPVMYQIFSLTKLMIHVQPTDTDVSKFEAVADFSAIWEISIASALQQVLRTKGTGTTCCHFIHAVPYDIRRKLIHVAESIFSGSLSPSTTAASATCDAPTPTSKARRYVHLACLIFDEAMLQDVLALRMSCRANLESRRFPVYCTPQYQELQPHLIESYIAYSASRFMSRGCIQGVINIHKLLKGSCNINT